MSTKAKAPARAATPVARSSRREPSGGTVRKKTKESGVLPTTDGPIPGTTEWHLGCIVTLGERVQEYVRLMGKVSSMASSSAEAKAKAIVAFHERLAILEQQLGRIHEELHLG